MSFMDNRVVLLKEAGRDENWVHDWIIAKPERLGIGSIEIINHELIQYRNNGGRLDILAYNRSINTFYEIEIMLGECDADHGFRTLDYWARERIKNPNSSHVAVLVAENLQGRYKTLIETLPQFLPFIGIELRTLELIIDDQSSVGPFFTCTAEIIAMPDEIVQQSTAITPRNDSSNQPRDEEWWIQKYGEKFVDSSKELFEYTLKNIGPSRIDYSASSYISLKKGTRAWLPMWPRKDGCYIYLPDNGNGTVEEPSERFNEWDTKLRVIGIELSWAYKYNAGANPIGFNLPWNRMKDPLILQLLKESYSLA